jgi:hypothetical protein
LINAAEGGVFCSEIAAREISVMNDQQRAERNFKKEERAKDGRKAMTEYEIQGRATREKTERLKALRLARDAQVQTDAPAAKPTKQAAQEARQRLGRQKLHRNRVGSRLHVAAPHGRRSGSGSGCLGFAALRPRPCITTLWTTPPRLRLRNIASRGRPIDTPSGRDCAMSLTPAPNKHHIAYPRNAATKPNLGTAA